MNFEAVPSRVSLVGLFIVVILNLELVLLLKVELMHCISRINVNIYNSRDFIVWINKVNILI